jgi:hypothetical protein
VELRIVKRHDYGQTLFSQLTGDITGRLALLRLRAAVLAIASLCIVGASVSSVELQRIAALDREYAALTQHAGQVAIDAQSARALSGRIAHDRLLLERVAAARREATMSSNAIASIGNALPQQTWLTNVTTGGTGAWTIAGRSTRVAEVGSTLRAIARLDHRAAARLVSIAASGRSGAILDFVIAWDRQP